MTDTRRGSAGSCEKPTDPATLRDAAGPRVISGNGRSGAMDDNPQNESERAFNPLRPRRLTLRNRLVFAPMVANQGQALGNAVLRGDLR